MARVSWSVVLVAAALTVAVSASDARRLLGPAPYLQCGGQGGECKGVQCKDAAWPAFKCPGEFVCGKINSYYWQCTEPQQKPTNTGTTTEPGKTKHTYKSTDFKQCGGTSGCKGSICRDGVWPGTSCVPGLTCYKVSSYYWTCDVKPPKKTGTQAPTPAKVVNTGNAWKQCGGLDGPTCTGAGKAACKDAPWAGFTCPTGFHCYRSNAWYWGCRTGPVTDG